MEVDLQAVLNSLGVQQQVTVSQLNEAFKRSKCRVLSEKKIMSPQCECKCGELAIQAVRVCVRVRVRVRLHVRVGVRAPV